MTDGIYERLQREHDALMRSVPGGAFKSTPDGECVFASAACAEMLGLCPEAVLGRGWSAAVHPEERARVLRAWSTAVATATEHQSEHRIVRPDGSVRWVWCRATPTVAPDGRVEAYVGTLTDVTEHRARDQLLGLTQRTLDLLPDPVYLGPTDGSFLLVNEAAGRMMGCSREQLLRLRVSDVDPNFPEDAWKAHVERLRANGALSFDSMGLRPDGSQFPIEVTVSLVHFEGNEYVCAVVRDVTEREHLAAQLRQAQKMEAIGTLASGIAHDFNNALTVIMGNLELMGLLLPREHGLSERLDAIRAASERATALVQQLMLFGRPRVHSRQAIDLAAVIRAAVSLLRGAIPASVDIVEEIADDVPPVKGDPAQMHQVLVNLCTNAWQAHDGRPGRITVGLSLVRTSEDGGRGVGRVMLRVSDQGAGMTPEVLARAFDPFFTTKPVGSGTGLGLSVVHGIVQGHGGSIEVESQPGKGTIFRIYFPASTPDGAPAEPTPRGTTAPPLSRTTKRVLYVDDETDVAKVAQEILTAEGHEVTTQTSAEAALADIDARPHEYDVVLTDLNMPRITGIELAAEIARRWSHLPVIVVSGQIDERVRTSALAAGARGVLPKPWTAGELARVVAEA